MPCLAQWHRTDLGYHGHWRVFNIPDPGHCGPDRRRFSWNRRRSLHYADAVRTECVGIHGGRDGGWYGSRLATGILHTFYGNSAILAGILTQLGLYSINLKTMGKRIRQSTSTNLTCWFPCVLSGRFHSIKKYNPDRSHCDHYSDCYFILVLRN